MAPGEMTLDLVDHPELGLRSWDTPYISFDSLEWQSLFFLSILSSSREFIKPPNASALGQVLYWPIR